MFFHFFLTTVFCIARFGADGPVLLRHGVHPGPRHRDRDLSSDGHLEQDGARLSHGRMPGKQGEGDDGRVYSMTEAVLDQIQDMQIFVFILIHAFVIETINLNRSSWKFLMLLYTMQNAFIVFI